MQIGGYEILRELGRGAMGIVYLAQDVQLARLVAIKTIQFAPGISEQKREAARHRFLREARAAAGLSHPHIITIHHIGEDDGLPYIVMEFVEGISLDEALHAATGWTPVLMDGLRQVASALDYAHARGLVHRDVKPANILISRTSVFKVADFGIVKVLDEDSMTQTGALIGTPGYSSPEQVRGEAVSGRSDQFALAIIAYRILIGRLPFFADSLAALFFQLANVEAADVAKINPALNAAVNPVMRKAMAKQPAQRFESCLEFIDALRAALQLPPGTRDADGPTVDAKPQPPNVPPVKPALAQERFTDPRWAVVALGLLAVAGVALVWWKRQPHPPPVIDGQIVEFRQPEIPLRNDSTSTKGRTDETKITRPLRNEPEKQPEEKQPEKEVFPVTLPSAPPVVGPRDGLTYAWIPAGKFQMGCSPGPICSSDEFRHTVTISKGFWLSSTEVTAGAYRKFVAAKGVAMPDTAVGRDEWNDPAMPVSNVSHTDAATYCAWIGGRLPTEAEWEYAARAGTTGPAYGRLSHIAWIYGEDLTVYFKLHQGKYPPVGKKEPNRFGLYDTIGNVSEWVADRYKEDYYRYSPAVDPQGPESGDSYVHRGGSMLTIMNNVSVSERGRGTDSRSVSPEIGFRCVGGMTPP